ncbi:MAG: RHS repeat-associated core domain-containing protein [Armatimonadota bacterium]|nr:RHS repeat-associated core domain-containing protein [Armatimonadota bacterium]
MIDPTGITSYEHDMSGRAAKVTRSGRWVAYKYDENGNRGEMNVHLDAQTEHVTSYHYNIRGLLDKVTDQLNHDTTYTYYDNGMVNTITYMNGTKAVHSYNSRNWLTTLSNQKSNGTVIAEFAYTYDPTDWGKSGNRTRVVENILKPDGNRINAKVDYEYDDLYRLVHETRTAYNGGDAGVTYEYNFAYDPAGNRTSWEIVGGATTTYSYDDANKMTGPGTFTYDDAGNTLTHVYSGTTSTYTWDCRNRLTQWEQTYEASVNFVYDGDGNRISKTSGSTTTTFVLDGAEVVEEITGASTVSYVGPGLLHKITGTDSATYHADGIGSTRVIMDDDGQTVVQALVYDAYGTLIAYLGGTGQPSFAYAGQYRYYADPETELSHLKARYYVDEVGRFLSADPVRQKTGNRSYDYVNGDPVNRVDPTGLFYQCTQIGFDVGFVPGIGGRGGCSEYLCHDPMSNCPEAWSIRLCYGCVCLGLYAGISVDIGACITRQLACLAGGWSVGGSGPVVGGQIDFSSDFFCGQVGVGFGGGAYACRCWGHITSIIHAH